MVVARRAALPEQPGSLLKTPKTIHSSKKFPLPRLENLPFLLVEFSQLSYKVLLFLAIHRRLFVQYFRHFEALPLSHNVHSIFRQNEGNLWVQGVSAPGAALDELLRRLVVVERHRWRGGWLGSAPRTSSSSLVRGCPTDASGKARQSTGQYGTSTHPRLRSETMKYFSANFHWKRARVLDSLMLVTF